MQKFEWKDNNIENTLKRMPIIEDHRDPQEIYQNIYSKVQKKEKKVCLLPTFATVAAIIIFTMIAPSLLKENLSLESIGHDTNGDNLVQMTLRDPNDADVASQESMALDDEDIHSYVVSSVPIGKTLLTYGLLDETGQNVIPVSILVDSNHQKSVVELLTENATKLPIHEIGLSMFPLKEYQFYEEERFINSEKNKVRDGNYITIDIPEKQMLRGSSQIQNFEQSVRETFRWLGYKTAEYSTNGVPDIETDQGVISGTSLIQNEKKGYFLYQLETGSSSAFLAAPPVEYEDFETALNQMHKPVEQYQLKPSIPSEIKINKIEMEEKHVVVHFQEGTVLEETNEHIFMINAIMMTAKEFGYETISFAGVNESTQIGNIILENKNTVPVAPNPIPFSMLNE